MARSTWVDLPASVRAAIEHRVGPVAHAVIPTAGRNSDFSATLHTEGGTVFCKGIADAEGARGTMHRHEADVNPWLPPMIAPRLRWRVETDGWLLLGFEHVPGRHADLSPGSPDLRAIVATVNSMAVELTLCSAAAPRLADQWARLAAWRRLADSPADVDCWTRRHLDLLVDWETRAVELVDGDSLVHTDLHSLNILVCDGNARIVDWAWSRRGAAAVDVAFLIARLIAAGHRPADAAGWAETLPLWRHTPVATRTSLAVAIWGIWEYQRRARPRPLWQRLVPAARAAARYWLAV